MKRITCFTLMLAAALIAGSESQNARAEERAPLTKVLQNVGDVAKELVKADSDREDAQRTRDRAKLELDAIKRGGPQAKERAEELRERIRRAEHRIRRATRELSKIPPIGFDATNENEVAQAQQIAQRLDEIFKKATGVQMSNRFRVEPAYNPSDKTGGIKIQWKGDH